MVIHQFHIWFWNYIDGFSVLVRLLSWSLQKETLSFNLVSTHSPSQTRQHWLSSHMSRVMAVLFGWQGTNSLATMPCSTFSKKVVSASSFVTTERLFSTECVTTLHFCRTYPQPCQFLMSSNCSLAQYKYITLSYYSPIDATSGIWYHQSSLTPSYV